MKRSNKLLTGLLLAIFIVPLGLFMAFNKMVKADDYTTIIHRKNDNIIHKKTGHYSTVKITVPELKNIENHKFLTCHLHSAKEGYYTYRKTNIMDSISITKERDTLFIKYVVKPHANATSTYYANYNVDLYLPDMKDIVVSRATLQLDSIDAAINPDINVRLTNAAFRWGDNIVLPNSKEISADVGDSSFLKKQTIPYRHLSINAKSSQIIFGHHLQMDTLSLNVERDSKLTIANDFQAGKINGTIDYQTNIISNIRTIKQLSNLDEQ